MRLDYICIVPVLSCILLFLFCYFTDIDLSTHYRFAKQYNEIIENEVKNRKMWLHENESWMNIHDNDVDDLSGFAKKLEEQKVRKIRNDSVAEPLGEGKRI